MKTYSGNRSPFLFASFAECDREAAGKVLEGVAEKAKLYFSEKFGNKEQGILKKASCIFVTAEANRALIEAMHMNWAESVDAALAQAYQELGSDSSVTVIPNGVGVIL